MSKPPSRRLQANQAPVCLRTGRRAWTTACVLLLSSAAGAFELPPVGGIDAVGREEKLVNVEFGVFYGTDTNVSRAPGGAELDDSFIRLLGGVAFATGNERRRFDLRIQATTDTYSELSQFDLEEVKVLLGLQSDMSTILMSLRAEYAMLADPTDIEFTDLLERTRMSLMPNLDIRLGKKLELSVGYSLKSSDYEGLFDYLDYDQTALVTEVRLGKSEGGRQVFAHFDKGEFKYGPGVRDDDDFKFDRVYGGLRTEASRSAHELAVGMNNLDAGTLPESEIYVTYRSTFQLGETRALLLGVARGPEAAANADYKVSTRILASYRHEVNTRWGWSIKVGNEMADFVNQDPAYPPDLSRLTVTAGVAAGVGSPDRMRGRLYLNAGYEKRDGPTGAYDYARVRMTAGLSLLY